jgi:hypothetical protein
MRRTAHGSISIAVLATLVSLTLNAVQGIYNVKYFRADKKTEALDSLVKFVNDNEQQFQSSFEAAKKKMQGQVQQLSLLDVQDINATIGRLNSDRDAMVSNVKERERIYITTYDRSYPFSDLSWVGTEALDASLRIDLKERYAEIRNRGENDTINTFFAFVGAVDLTWDGVTTLQSVNVRRAPAKGAPINAAIPQSVQCQVISVTSDQAWYEIQGRGPKPFQGWVDVQFLKPSDSFILNPN